MIESKLERIWRETRAWPGYLQAMSALIAAFTPRSKEGNRRLAQYASLPGLCCQAAGGQAEWADELATAWLVFYGAAYVMDAIEDEDEPAPEWASFSPGLAVNAASGLYFSASLILNEMKQQAASRPVAAGTLDEIIADFYRSFLVMCGGQHRDLATLRPSLAEYREIAEAKSGAFFAAACRLGARLATGEVARLQGFHDFGVRLGLIIQILDDIDEVQKIPRAERWDGLTRSLPVIFVLEKGDPAARRRLEALLQGGPGNSRSGEEILDIIDAAGGVSFLLGEYGRQRDQAVAALRQARPKSDTEARLLGFLPAIY